jgi:rubrerythrin
MSKGHRDNHAARKKRGSVAFSKKAERRKPVTKCNLCGQVCRSHKLNSGLCPICFERTRQWNSASPASLMEAIHEKSDI